MPVATLTYFTDSRLASGPAPARRLYVAVSLRRRREIPLHSWVLVSRGGTRYRAEVLDYGAFPGRDLDGSPRLARRVMGRKYRDVGRARIHWRLLSTPKKRRKR